MFKEIYRMLRIVVRYTRGLSTEVLRSTRRGIDISLGEVEGAAGESIFCYE